MKFCLLQVNGWICRTSSYVKFDRFRKPKAACFLSYVEYKYKQCYEKQFTLSGGHIQEREVKRRTLRR
jgi:hypothetical protein